MSHFYGTLQGNRGEASRCGSTDSGIDTYAAGWRGAIHVSVYQDSDGVDCFDVTLQPWQNSGGDYHTLACGKLDARTETESGWGSK